MTMRRIVTRAARLGLSALAQPFLPIAMGGRSAVCALTYHRVNDDPDDRRAVRTEDFSLQMAFLAESGLSVMRLGDLHEELDGQKAGVCVTFDDGYMDNWRDAAPILGYYGIPATFFVTTGYLGTSRRFHWDIRDEIIAPMMDWDHVRALAAAGHEIGAHTRTHPDLGKPFPVEFLEDEIVGSADDIERHLGFRPKSFAFPFGRWENMLPAAAEIAERTFPICCSAVRGRMRIPLEARMILRRVSVQPTWSFAEFRAELAGVFDFLERFRY